MTGFGILFAGTALLSLVDENPRMYPMLCVQLFAVLKGVRLSLAFYAWFSTVSRL